MAGHQEKWQLKYTVSILEFYIYHSVKITAFYLHYAHPQCTIRIICGDKGLSTGKAWAGLFAGPGTPHSLHRLQHHIEFSAFVAINHTDWEHQVRLSLAVPQDRSRSKTKEPLVGASEIYSYIHFFTTSFCLWEFIDSLELTLLPDSKANCQRKQAFT